MYTKFKLPLLLHQHIQHKAILKQMLKENVRALLQFILIMCFALQLNAQQKHIFSFGGNNFLLDGKPFQIISGEMHPARIPQEYWKQRIQMAKAMGCNTIAVYVFWNYQETAPGQFDFITGNHNIAEFINLCKQQGMWVLLRPGPYVCAEWDFGGLPAYLLKYPDIKVRCMDERYMVAVTTYIHQLSKQIKPLQCTNGGPVLMVQVENEYGSYGNDKSYLNALKKLWVDDGIEVPFYTADGPTPYMLEAGSVEGAAIGLDSGGSDDDFNEAEKQNPRVPSFSSETYPGWFTHWKEKWAVVDTADVVKDVKWLLDHKKSFNLYVVHGGTNFGFTAGANAFSPTAYQPDVTSYDYDAPIDEQGNATAKFYALRNLISRYVDYKLPDVPKPVPAIEIPEIKMEAFTTIWQQLPQPVLSPQPEPFENFNQNQGCMLYRTTLIGHKSGTLTITEPHDFALVFLDGKFIDTIFRDGLKRSVKLPANGNKNPVLDILVEGMGHINFAQYIIDRKGITDRVTLNGMTLMNWKIYPLPLDEKFIASLKQTTAPEPTEATFFKGRFNLATTGDVYFDVHNYSKGVLYINGHNAGRYWNAGPQYRLYCPASWLKKGENEIVLFDLLQHNAATVTGVKTLK